MKPTKFFKVMLLDNYIPYYLSTLLYTMHHEGFSITFRLNHKYDTIFKEKEEEKKKDEEDTKDTEDLVLCIPINRIAAITIVDLSEEEYNKREKHSY